MRLSNIFQGFEALIEHLKFTETKSGQRCVKSWASFLNKNSRISLRKSMKKADSIGYKYFPENPSKIPVIFREAKSAWN